jgi:hypothetical protein
MKNLSRAFVIGIAINLLNVIIELSASYFPMQNLLKICPRISLVVTSPVI